MNKGDRGALWALGMALLAIVIIAIFVSGPGDPPNANIGQPNTAHAEHRQDGDVTKLVSSTDDFRPWRDTYAQWLMAILSIAATGVSIWAVGLVRHTLAETQKATKAANETNAVTREIGEAQVRAYLSCTGAKYQLFADRLECTLSIVNRGQSPASNIVLTGTVSLTVWNGEKDNPRPLIEAATNAVIGNAEIIAAGAETTGRIVWDFEGENEDAVQMLKAGIPLDIFARVIWDDVFSARQTLNVVLHETRRTKNGKKRVPFKRRGVLSAYQEDLYPPYKKKGEKADS